MSGVFAPYLALRQIPPGRAIFALREIKALLGQGESGDDEVLLKLRNLIDHAIELNVEAFRIRQRYDEQQAGSSARGQAAILDPLINEAVRSIHDMMSGMSRGIDEDDEEARLAAEVLRIAFASGLAAIVQVPFEIQVSTVDAFLAHFAAGGSGHDPGPLQHTVKPLRLEKRLERLERLNRRFENELRSSEHIISMTDVDIAFQKGQQALHRVFIRILATYDEDSSEHITQRSRLLKPILFQDSRLAELNRRSRRVVDVNPETGVERQPDELSSQTAALPSSDERLSPEGG